ncbi:MAG: protein-methionine-sulfoxide reductase heme-binding subunit MsrQ [Colwellia sp.]
MKKEVYLKIIIHLGSLLPLVYLYSLALTDQLGADPVEEVIHFTGIGAFNLLLLSLCASPLSKTFKQNIFIKVRRLLGLYAFTYALCHLSNFILLDLQLDWSLFFSEVFKRPYISIGMIAFTILLALAITSIPSLKRVMGKSWHKLHKSVYFAVLLVGIHYYWSVKSSLISPVLYLIMVLILLSFRYKKKLGKSFKSKSKSK